jgi:hypothetical protein
MSASPTAARTGIRAANPPMIGELTHDPATRGRYRSSRGAAVASKLNDHLNWAIRLTASEASETSDRAHQ